MNKRLLEKYFKGECTSEEVQQVLEWFENEELDPKQDQELYQLWQELQAGKDDGGFASNAAKIFDTIQEKIDHPGKNQLPGKESDPAGRTLHLPAGQWQAWGKVAAAILIPVCFLWLLLLNPFAPDKDAAQLVTGHTPPGKRKTIILEDGSKITLNAGSTITYLKPFSKDIREITLKGEAFFEVQKDSLRPFIVKTGVLTTQALGTSFNIKYRPREQDITVALATGSVKIEKKENKTGNQVARLVPGQQLVYDKVGQGFQVSAFDPREVLSWREGVLYFKKATLGQVVSKLEAWYGVEVTMQGKVPDAVNEWRYTGAYHNQSLPHVLEGIAFVKNFSYERKDNKVILRFK